MQRSGVLTSLTKVFFWGYLAVFTAAGLFGMLGAPWELRHEIGVVQLSETEPAAYANLVHQIRFLRTVELGFALLCIYLSSTILRDRKLACLFALTAGLATAARIISWVVEGRPDPLFVLSAVGEGITAVLMFLYARTLPKG